MLPNIHSLVDLSHSITQQNLDKSFDMPEIKISEFPVRESRNLNIEATIRDSSSDLVMKSIGELNPYSNRNDNS